MKKYCNVIVVFQPYLVSGNYNTCGHAEIVGMCRSYNKMKVCEEYLKSYLKSKEWDEEDIEKLVIYEHDLTAECCGKSIGYFVTKKA